MDKAYIHNIVLSGLSAGSICWYIEGHSDSSLETNPDGRWDTAQVRGLGLIFANHCPHYNEKGHETFDRHMIYAEVPGIALENNTAMVIEDNMYKILKSNVASKAFLIKQGNGKINKIELNNGDFRPLSEILS